MSPRDCVRTCVCVCVSERWRLRDTLDEEEKRASVILRLAGGLMINYISAQ